MIFKRLCQELSYYLFPSCCAHCGELHQEKFLCSSCAPLIELIETKGRCQKCFRQSRQRICDKCCANPSFYHASAALFEREGVNRALLDLYYRAKRPALSDLLASFAIVQTSRLKWESPTLIAYQSKRYAPFSKRLAKRWGIKCYTLKRVEKTNLEGEVLVLIEVGTPPPLFPAKLYGLKIGVN